MPDVKGASLSSSLILVATVQVHMYLHFIVSDALMLTLYFEHIPAKATYTGKATTVSTGSSVNSRSVWLGSNLNFSCSSSVFVG